MYASSGDRDGRGGSGGTMVCGEGRCGRGKVGGGRGRILFRLLRD